MKTGKKITALLLTLLMVAGVLGACGKDSSSGEGNSSEGSSKTSEQKSASNEETDTPQGEPVEISIAAWDIDSSLQGDRVHKEIEEKLNIKIKPVNVSWDDYVEKVQLWAASDSLPDLFTGPFRTTANFSKWANEGLLKAIPKDLSAYPNLEQYMDNPVVETCKVGDDVYCIFRQTYGEQAETIKDRMILYRWDLAQEAGITKEPENWDEFRTMIKAIKEADPAGNNVQGMTSFGPQILVGIMFTYSMPLAVNSDINFYWIDDGEGNYIPAYFAGEEFGSDAIPTWQLARDMYDDGTIEADIAMSTVSQGEEKFLNGQSAAVCMSGTFGSAYTRFGQYWEDIYGNDFFDDVKYLDIMPSVDGNDYYCVWDYAWSENYISANVDDVKLDRILSLYDYLLSEEGTILSVYGYEGDTYEVLDDGRISYIDDIPAAEKYPSINTFSCLTDWMYGLQDTADFKPDRPEEYVAKDAERTARAKAITMPEYNQECTNTFIAMGSDFALKVNEDFVNIMTGSEPVETMWNKIIDGYKANGIEKIIQQVNTEVK